MLGVSHLSDSDCKPAISSLAFPIFTALHSLVWWVWRKYTGITGAAGGSFWFYGRRLYGSDHEFDDYEMIPFKQDLSTNSELPGM